MEIANESECTQHENSQGGDEPGITKLCCTINSLDSRSFRRYEVEVPENPDFRRHREREDHEHGSPRSRPPKPYYYAGESFPIPYPRRPQPHHPRKDGVTSDRFDKTRVLPRRPQQLSWDQGNDFSHIITQVEDLKILMGQYLDYQLMTESTTHERIDKVNESLCGKLASLPSFMKEFEKTLARDAAAIDNKFRWVEEELRKIVYQQKRFEEVLASEFKNVIESHKLLKEIDSEIKVRYYNLSKKLEELSNHVGRHDIKEEEENTMACNAITPFNDQRNQFGLSLLHNRWYPRIIRLKELGEFNRAVSKLPPGTSFTKACSDFNIDRFFLESCETRKEMRELYHQALHYPRPQQTLQKVDSPGRFLIDLFIRGIEFEDALCDSGSCINLMSTDIARRIGIKELQPSKIRIGLADSSSTTPKGMVSNLYVRIGNCNIPTDFHIVELHGKGSSSLILGGSFLATVGAVMDWPNQGMFFANVDKGVLYKTVPFAPNTRCEKEDGKPPDDYTEEQVKSYSKEGSQRACPQADSPPRFA